jgi:alanyl-tRNA synthetase
MQKDHDIAYELETTDGIDVGSEVEMKIDQEKRTKLRKLHSLVHIADYVFEEVCGKHESVGSRISPHKGRIDYKYPENINSKLPEIQEKIEKVIQEGHEIKRYVDDEESDRWMWEMNGFKMPCGGTHVRNSSEIGKIKLKRANIGKGKERIECMLVE